jgi:hypothetical protein
MATSAPGIGPPAGPKNDLLWVCLCGSSEVAVSIILNKYSSLMPLLLIAGICAIPVALLIAVVWRHEKQHGWVKRRFLEHPVSYALIVLICLPFFWYTTAILISRLKDYSKPNDVASEVKKGPSSTSNSPIPAPTKTDKSSQTPAPLKAAPPPSHHRSQAPPQKPGSSSVSGITNGNVQQQNNSDGHNVQQYSAAPNSPNIAGDGNSVTYTDTSQLPVLNKKQLDAITNQLSTVKYKIVIDYDYADADASLLANDLGNAIKNSGSFSSWVAVAGEPVFKTVSYPVSIGANSNTVDVSTLQSILEGALHLKIPIFPTPSMPDGEIWIILVSRPVKRPG